jgi:uncharacterized YigZ family protein
MSTYFTLQETGPEICYKIKNSKFYAKAFYTPTDEDIKQAIAFMHKVHPDACHHCYAFVMESDGSRTRANDDGEPTYSAGKPILSQIQAKGVTYTTVIVSRIYGGIKLGVGGLISAYRQAALEALSEMELKECVPVFTKNISCPYERLSNIMRLIKENQWQIKSVFNEETAKITLEIPLADQEKAEGLIENSFLGYL